MNSILPKVLFDAEILGLEAVQELLLVKDLEPGRHESDPLLVLCLGGGGICLGDGGGGASRYLVISLCRERTSYG